MMLLFFCGVFRRVGRMDHVRPDRPETLLPLSRFISLSPFCFAPSDLSRVSLSSLFLSLPMFFAPCLLSIAVSLCLPGSFSRACLVRPRTQALSKYAQHAHTHITHNDAVIFSAGQFFSRLLYALAFRCRTGPGPPSTTGFVEICEGGT